MMKLLTDLCSQKFSSSISLDYSDYHYYQVRIPHVQKHCSKTNKIVSVIQTLLSRVLLSIFGNELIFSLIAYSLGDVKSYKICYYNDNLYWFNINISFSWNHPRIISNQYFHGLGTSSFFIRSNPFSYVFSNFRSSWCIITWKSRLNLASFD